MALPAQQTPTAAAPDAKAPPPGTSPAPSVLPPQSPAAIALSDFIRNRFSELASDRTAEDTLWYQTGLFDLGKHWQKYDGDGPSARIVPMTARDFGTDPSQRWTAPVTDHFTKTVAANATALGAVLPRVTALSGNYDARSRRAASYAEAVFDTANRESGMDILNPILARQNVLWGIAWTKDEVAFDLATEDVPELDDAGAPVASARVPAPRLRTTLPSPFAVYIPRDCSDPNLAPELYERVVYRLGEAREMFPDYAAALTADGSSNDTTAAYTSATSNSLAAFYQQQLTRLGGTTSSGSSSPLAQSATSVSSGGSNATSNTSVEYLTGIEGWIDWDTLPQSIQDLLEAEWADSPSVVDEYAERGQTRVSAAQTYGIFGIVWQDYTLQYGENPNHGDTPQTAYMWEKNSLNPYGSMGLGRVLMPLQRQLNRLDALHDRQLASTGTTKVFLPESQQFDPPSGDPVDIFRWDDMMGKAKPELFPAGNAGGIPAKRAQIVQEFAFLGYTEGVASGQNTSGADSFRAIAYLGGKAEEQRGTQRALWEQSHTRRSRKLLRMAKRVWTEARKIKVAGPNNRFGAEMIEGADLDFETDQITIVQGSSKPKTLQETLEALQTLAMLPGFIDPQDQDFKQFVLDKIGIPEVSLWLSLQDSKADRDLQVVLTGQQPVSSPAQDWSVVVRKFAQYTLTEEWETLDADKQAGVLGYMAWAQQLGAVPVALPGPQQGGQPGADPTGAAGGAGAGLPGAPQSPTQNPGGTLSKVPGKSANLKNTETAAQTEGNGVASAVDNSASSYHL